MTEKDKASPRQRVSMEQRWDDARRDCAYERCNPVYHFHAAGCPRRKQRIKVTNLNTGVESEATIVHIDTRAVKDVLADHDKQAVRLEPVEQPGEYDYDLSAPQHNLLEPEVWSRWEKGLFEDRMPVIEVRDENQRHPVFIPSTEPAPARPWWRFWGRRG